MRIVFAGTAVFAVPMVQALLESGHTICAVYTKPDQPQGRGQRVQPSPVKEALLAQWLHLLHQPTTLRSEQEVSHLQSLSPDVLVVVAYGLILPPAILSIPKYGCINVHASLLPRWRGAAPIIRAVEAGDLHTGVTIMQMDAGLDTGPILRQETCAILPHEDTGHLQTRLATLGAKTLVATLGQLAHSPLAVIAKPQDDTLANYAKKVSKEEALLNWQLSAEVLVRKICAFNPVPVAFSYMNEAMVRVWQAYARLDDDTSALPGEIVMLTDDEIRVATGSGVLAITELQWPGKKRLSVREFLLANRAKLGTKFYSQNLV